MVCLRCQLVVKDEIERVGLEYDEVKLGEAVIKEPATAQQLQQLQIALLKSGLEIIDGKKSQLVEKIKAVIIQQIHYSEEALTVNYSTYLANQLNYDYTYLSNLFAANQGMTLEHFILYNKIEKVKEMLIYDEMTISEIAIKMNYSSAAHLSTQFKKITGFTATHYKKIKQIRFNNKRSVKKPKE